MVELKEEISYCSREMTREIIKEDSVKVHIHVREFANHQQNMRVKQKLHSYGNPKDKRMYFRNGNIVKPGKPDFDGDNRSRCDQTAVDSDYVDVDEYSSVPIAPTFVNVLYIDRDSEINIRTIYGDEKYDTSRRNGPNSSVTDIYNVE